MTKLKQKDIRRLMGTKRKMIAVDQPTHTAVLEYLESIKQSTGLKITFSSFNNAALFEKIQRDKHKNIIR